MEQTRLEGMRWCACVGQVLGSGRGLAANSLMVESSSDLRETSLTAHKGRATVEANTPLSLSPAHVGGDCFQGACSHSFESLQKSLGPGNSGSA